MMDSRFSSEEEAFRQEVSAFIDTELTPDLIEEFNKLEGEGYKQANLTWMRKLRDKGWLLYNWPEEYGGTGWSATERFIFDSAFVEKGAPKPVSFNFSMIGPVLYTYANKEQKERFLKPLVNCETWWCQGYSEPGSGSDLASLQTKAERDGDDYVINGTKIWTTYAQLADWMFILVRTSSEGKKQAGITFLLVDMKSPGIEVQKVSTIDGFHSLNQVYLTNVRVPVANRIGDENKGWTYAKGLLNHERASQARVAESKRYLSELKRIASNEPAGGGGALIDKPSFARKLAKAEIDLMALEYSSLRVLSASSAGEAPGNEAAILKLQGGEFRQRMHYLRLEVAGYYKGFVSSDLSASAIEHDFALKFTQDYLHGRAATIAGGTSEVQRNIVAKSVLGLS